jgi:hypothetical protein
MTGPNIVTLDIETFPNLVYTWGLWKQTVGVNQIVRDWSLASICWKWLGERVTHYVDASADPRNDTDIALAAWEVLDQADIVIGQNSKHFDIRKLNARFIELGLPPPSPFKQIDTKVEAAKVAMFTSNRLEWLSAHLTDEPKDKHKAFPGFDLWSECLKGNPKAWAAMRKYNPKDVKGTEKVYLKLRPWIAQHPNVAIYTATARCAARSAARTRSSTAGCTTHRSRRANATTATTAGAGAGAASTPTRRLSGSAADQLMAQLRLLPAPLPTD